MANRYFTQYRYSLEKSVVDLFAHVTFGASGAPTLDAANSKGIKSISRTSAGLYVLTLQDPYTKFLMAKHVFVSTSAAPASPSMYVSAALAVTTTAAPTITITFNAAGTATDPATGEQVYLQISVGNSSAI